MTWAGLPVRPENPAGLREHGLTIRDELESVLAAPDVDTRVGERQRGRVGDLPVDLRTEPRGQGDQLAVDVHADDGSRVSDPLGGLAPDHARAARNVHDAFTPPYTDGRQQLFGARREQPRYQISLVRLGTRTPQLVAGLTLTFYLQRHPHLLPPWRSLMGWGTRVTPYPVARTSLW